MLSGHRHRRLSGHGGQKEAEKIDFYGWAFDDIEPLAEVLVVRFPCNWQGESDQKGNYSGFEKSKGIQHSSPISRRTVDAPVKQ